MNLTRSSLQKMIKKAPVESVFIGFLALAMAATSVPNVFSAEGDVQDDGRENGVLLEIAAMQNVYMPYGTLPKAANRPAPKQMTIPVTAYNSVPWQTDATPCIGAQGTDICKYLEAGSNTCAANFVPLGTVLEVEGLGTCVVRDRMNARYWYRVDWYMGMDITGAKQFGLQKKNVGIYDS